VLAGEYIQAREEKVCVTEQKAANSARPPKLLDRRREALRTRHYSRRIFPQENRWKNIKTGEEGATSYMERDSLYFKNYTDYIIIVRRERK